MAGPASRSGCNTINSIFNWLVVQVDSWREYVRPTINPVLSEFCVGLTGIQQETVAAALTFPAILQQFQLWLDSHGLGANHTFAVVTDGKYPEQRSNIGWLLQAGRQNTEKIHTN